MHADVAQPGRAEQARPSPRGAPRRRPSDPARPGSPSKCTPPRTSGRADLADGGGCRSPCRPAAPSVCPASAAWRVPDPRRGDLRRSPGRPATATTGCPGRSRARSLVGQSRCPRQRALHEGRFTSQSVREPCGVWASPSPADRRCARSARPSTSLTVSWTPSTGIAAPCAGWPRSPRPRAARRPAAGRRRGPARRASPAAAADAPADRLGAGGRRRPPRRAPRATLEPPHPPGAVDLLGRQDDDDTSQTGPFRARAAPTAPARCGRRDRWNCLGTGPPKRSSARRRRPRPDEFCSNRLGRIWPSRPPAAPFPCSCRWRRFLRCACPCAFWISSSRGARRPRRCRRPSRAS